jgi:hypothetical protein
VLAKQPLACSPRSLAGKDGKIKQYEIQIAALRVRLAALQMRTKPGRDAETRSRSEAA